MLCLLLFIFLTCILAVPLLEISFPHFYRVLKQLPVFLHNYKKYNKLAISVFHNLQRCSTQCLYRPSSPSTHRSSNRRLRTLTNFYVFVEVFRPLYERIRWPIMPMYGGFPVKMRTHIGKPIKHDPSLTPEALSNKVCFVTAMFSI